MYSISVPNVMELPTVIENVKHGIGPITNKDAKKSNNKRIIKERDNKYIVTLCAHEWIERECIRLTTVLWLSTSYLDTI